MKKRIPDPAPKHSILKYDLLAISALLTAGFLAYSNTFLCPFRFDDMQSIVGNIAIRQVLHPGNIWSYWPTRFITYLSLALNYHFHQLSVFGYHVFNLAVHLGSGILVWWLALLTFSTPAMKGQKIASHARLVSFFTALVFVMHPIQTQAVTYIIQRATSLATFFYLASLCLYAKSRLCEASGRRIFYYGGSLITAVMAMFTKEIAITLPLMICFYDFSFLKTRGGSGWKRALPFLFCLAIIPTTMVLTKFVDIRGMRRAVESAPDISSANYLLTQFRVLVTYIRLLFLPLNQNLDYDYPVAHALFQPAVFASLLFLAGIFMSAIRSFRDYRLISFGIFWFYLTLLPESSFIPIKDVIYEHRLYLPMAGFSIFLASGLYYLFGKRNLRVPVAMMVMIIICFSALTYARNSVWRDELTLWNDSVRKSPHKARPYADRGKAYAEKGDLDRALSDFNKALEIDPHFAGAYYNRGLVYQIKGNLDLALFDYSSALSIQPIDAAAYYNRGLVYQNKGNLDLALADFNRALEIMPDYLEAYINKGYIHAQKGDFDLALEDFNIALEIKPDNLESYINKGYVHVQKGDFDLALADYNKALEINPGSAIAYNNRELLYKKINGK